MNERSRSTVPASLENPRRLTPSMSLLLAFEASARHLSFTRAAQELSLTQSAVSRHVKALEELLEVSLFRRQGRTIALTDIGKMYQAELAATLPRIRNASLQAIAYRKGGGAFHLAVLPTFAAKWLMPRLNGFYAKHPGTLVHVHSRIGYFDLDLAGIDAVISVGDGSWPAAMTSHHLTDETVVPIISPSLAGKYKITEPGDLLRHLLLQVAARPDNWRKWCLEHGLSPRSMQMGPQFELTSHLIQAVSSGIGVGLVPYFLVEEELRSGALQVAIDAPMETGAAYYLFVPPDKIALPPIKAFVNWFLENSGAPSFR